MQRRNISRLGYLSCALIGCAIAWSIYAMTRPVDEVVLTLGEPYEQVRKQSHSTLPPVEPDTSWAGVLIRPAKLRFVDSRYGFVTPAAKFFMVQYDKNGNGKLDADEEAAMKADQEKAKAEKTEGCRFENGV